MAEKQEYLWCYRRGSSKSACTVYSMNDQAGDGILCFNDHIVQYDSSVFYSSASLELVLGTREGLHVLLFTDTAWQTN